MVKMNPCTLLHCLHTESTVKHNSSTEIWWVISKMTWLVGAHCLNLSYPSFSVHSVLKKHWVDGIVWVAVSLNLPLCWYRQLCDPFVTLFDLESKIFFFSLFKTEIKRMSVFKSYEPGEPTCRLYVKNIAKQVEEKVGAFIALDPLMCVCLVHWMGCLFWSFHLFKTFARHQKSVLLNIKLDVNPHYFCINNIINNAFIFIC